MNSSITNLKHAPQADQSLFGITNVCMKLALPSLTNAQLRFQCAKHITIQTEEDMENQKIKSNTIL